MTDQPITVTADEGDALLYALDYYSKVEAVEPAQPMYLRYVDQVDSGADEIELEFETADERATFEAAITRYLEDDQPDTDEEADRLQAVLNHH